jgi:hypothetical protein
VFRAEHRCQNASFLTKTLSVPGVAEPVICGGRGLPLVDFSLDNLRDIGCRQQLARDLPASKPCPRAGEMLAGSRGEAGRAVLSRRPVLSRRAIQIGRADQIGGVDRLRVADGRQG